MAVFLSWAETLTHPAARGDTATSQAERGARSWLQGIFWSSWQCQGEPSPGNSLGQAGCMQSSARLPGNPSPLWQEQPPSSVVQGCTSALCSLFNSNKVFLFSPQCLCTHPKLRNQENRREGKFRFAGFWQSFTLVISNAFSELSCWELKKKLTSNIQG